ncbi:hypothetical protein AB0L65_57970 [Nonomuraea sp. NPDC052116]|uniref:hypothetical protein n=1 Tax=Nonomuraea sp. NPDC052116 TaxID=3155665 RepID=UPI00341AD398
MSGPEASSAASPPATGTRRTRATSPWYSMNTTPPSASAASLNGTDAALASSRGLPCAGNNRRLLPVAATMPPFTGMADVTCPARSTGAASRPDVASSTDSRVRDGASPGSPPPLACVITLRSPCPQPGLK